MSNPQTPVNAREMLESMQADIRRIQSALLIPDGNQPAGPPTQDPAIELLSSILTVAEDLQTSQEKLHQRLDAVARFIPAASR